MSQNSKRILAIDPSPRGFGFAVLEGPSQLLDWGVKSANPEDKNVASMKQLELLVALYKPDVLVIEDATDEGSLRRDRVQQLLHQVAELGFEHELKTVQIPRLSVREVFARFGAMTKYQIAEVIAQRLPELGPKLPPPRKPWMAEDARMSIFDAVSFGLTFFHLREKRRLAA